MDRVALAGVDWGKSENAFVVRGKDGAVWRDRFPQTPQGVHLWAAALRSRYPEGKVAVALEQSRGALIYALSTYDFIELLTVHPSQTAAYRGVARPSGAKSDPIDADLIYDFVEKHSEKVRALQAVDALTRELTLLVEWRRKLVEQRTSLGQQLSETLGQYYPQALELMGERNSPMSLDFILQWSTLEKLQRSRPATIRNFYTSHNCRSKKVIEQRLALIASAVALHTDAARISALSAIACSLASLVQSVSEQISELDRRIKELWSSHPDYAVLDSFPGVGEVFGPRLAAALGTDRDRWDATTLSNFSGIAPLTEASGSTRWCTCAGPVRSSSARPSTSSPAARSHSVDGRPPSTNVSEPPAKATTLPSAPSRSAGYASSYAAGRIESLTTTRATPPGSSPPIPQTPPNPKLLLDRPPQCHP